MNIIPYTTRYTKQVEAITIATSSKAATDPIHRQFTLAMYCDAYLKHGIVYVLEENDHIYGYIMCAPDFDDFIKNNTAEQNIIQQLPDHYETRAQNEWQTYEKYKKQYPAHMHIDLLKEARGHHFGTKLINVLLEKLKEEEHVKGLMLGVGKDNTSAIAFYRKNGFSVLEETDTSYLMGQALKQRGSQPQ